ncbi:MAG: hypothetical protein ACYDB9_08275 [Gammaproteobacteria bacterium]
MMLGLAGLCSGCNVVYTMNGALTPSTPLDPDFEQVAVRVMKDMHLNVSISPTIQDRQQSIALVGGHENQIAYEKFLINPMNSIKVTAKSMQALSDCDQAEPNRCGVASIRVIRLASLAGIVPNDGFWVPNIYLGITAEVVSPEIKMEKTCTVAGYGPSRWSLWVSSHNLTPSFQIAVRNAFTKAFICLLTPDSRYNLPDQAPYLATKSAALER